jgi:FG-GAP repeat
MRRPCRAALCSSLLTLTAFCATAGRPALAETIDLRTDADLVVPGPWFAGRTGETLAAGDFDGDGHEDLAIGSSGARRTEGTTVREGVVQIVFGGPDVRERLAAGLSGTPPQIWGSRDRHAIGGHIAAGDFDGDGKTDLIFGSPWTTEADTALTDAGAAYLVFGRDRSAFDAPLTLPDDADAVFVPSERDVHLGEGLAIGDFDGDGKGDLAIGAIYANGPEGVRSHAGAVYLYLGRARKKVKPRVQIVREADLAIHGAERDDTLGRSIAFSDWNADRKMDLFVGVYYGDGPYNTRVDPGEAHLLLGREKKALGKLKPKGVIDLLDPGQSMPVFGGCTRGATGRPVCAGDIDGDGFGDLLVGSYLAPEEGARAQSGTMDAIFGGFVVPEAVDLGGPPEFRIVGARYFDHLGQYMQAGDLNGDGLDEVLVGAPYADPFGPDSMPRLQAGILGIVLGRAKKFFPDTLDLATGACDHLIHGADAGDDMPKAIEVLDIDADGKADLVIGAPETKGRENRLTHAGEIYFLFGASRSW